MSNFLSFKRDSKNRQIPFDAAQISPDPRDPREIHSHSDGSHHVGGVDSKKRLRKKRNKFGFVSKQTRRYGGSEPLGQRPRVGGRFVSQKHAEDQKLAAGDAPEESVPSKKRRTDAP